MHIYLVPITYNENYSDKPRGEQDFQDSVHINKMSEENYPLFVHAKLFQLFINTH